MREKRSRPPPQAALAPEGRTASESSPAKPARRGAELGRAAPAEKQTATTNTEPPPNAEAHKAGLPGACNALHYTKLGIMCGVPHIIQILYPKG